MKRLLIGSGLVLFCLAACQTAHTEGEPVVVVVPPDEMSRVPSLGPATTAASEPEDSQPAASPAASADSTPPVQVSVSPTHREVPVKHSYSSCHVSGPYIAMTFDDGPSAKLTPRLLDMLKERGIKATFFVVGSNAKKYPQIIRRMVAEGHEVANHSWNHPSLNKLGSRGLRHQLEDTNAAIVKAGAPQPVLVRPPYGATNARLNKRMDEEYGMKSILWSVDPLDWKYRNSNRVYSSIVEKARPGAIILSHDIHSTTVAAMPRVFDTLLAKGYQFVTVSELIAMDGQPSPLVKKEASPEPSAPPASSAPSRQEAVVGDPTVSGNH